MSWEAIVLDLDDTLYPEHQYVLSGLRSVAAWVQQELGLPERQTFFELRRLQKTCQNGQTFNAWTELRELDVEKCVPAMVQIYRQHRPDIVPFADVLPFLRQFADRKALGLVSDGFLEAQRRKWEALDLQQYFRAVVFSDELGRDNWKPSPLPFSTALERLAVPPRRAVYVGDNPRKDFRGARRAGMSSIRVRRPGGLYKSLEPSSVDDSPDIEISNLFELTTLL